MAIDALVYLSLGNGKHVDEIRFSILSADKFRSGDGGWQIVLYTDRPEPFAGLPVDIRLLDPATVEAWVGPQGYVYRAKIRALARSLTTGETTRSVIIDGDTYFKRSPEALFNRIGPRRSLMHLREGPPAPPEAAALQRVLAEHDPHDLAGRPWGVAPDEILWNSGVVGLHRSDVALCHEAEHLTDQLLEHGFAEQSHIAEMVAFGVCLDRRTEIGECVDVVMHYWLEELRRPFLARLQAAWADPSVDQPTQFAQLWEHRPQESAKMRTKLAIKQLARKVGVDL